MLSEAVELGLPDAWHEEPVKPRRTSQSRPFGEVPTFYATPDSTFGATTLCELLPDVPVLLPASSWASNGKGGNMKLRRPSISIGVRERAADCGAYGVVRRWDNYPFMTGEYVAWLDSGWAPSWAATQDCCVGAMPDPQDPEVIAECQEWSTRFAAYTWETYGDAPWTWCPTVQGWLPEDYRRHAEALGPLVREMQSVYYENGRYSSFRVGIGSICRRRDPKLVREIVRAVVGALPGVPLHLWGIKVGELKYPEPLPVEVSSFDSAAWNSRFGRDLEAQKASGQSQRVYALAVSLPAYIERVREELGRPRQPPLMYG